MPPIRLSLNALCRGACLWLLVGLVAAQQFQFRSYGTDEGLTSLSVRDLFQDKAGYIWISTEGGIFRYDGRQFRHFTESDGMPFHLQAGFADSPDGSVLVGFESGLYRFDGDRFTRVKVPGDPKIANSHGVRYDGHGNVYVSTNKGLWIAAGPPHDPATQWRRAPDPPGGWPGVGGVVLDGKLVWYPCAKTAVCSFNGSEVQRYGPTEGVPASVWYGGTVDAAGAVWFRSMDDRLLLCRRGDHRFEEVTSRFPRLETGPLSTDAVGRVAIPGIEGLSIANGGVLTIGREAGITPPVACFLEDREGSVWLGLAGRGLQKWAGYRVWDGFTAASGLPDELPYALLAFDDGRMLMGSETGLYWGTNRQGRWTWQAEPAFRKVRVRSLRRARNGDLWVAAEQRGVARFNPRTSQATWIRAGSLPAAYSDALEDSHGALWVGSLVGLFRAAPGSTDLKPVTGLSAVRVWQLAELPNGDILAATLKGLVRVSGDQVSVFTTAHGLADNRLLSLAVHPAGSIWVGYRSRGTVDEIVLDGERIRVKHHDLAEPEPPSITYFIGFDREHHVWAGTDRGVRQWDGNTWTRFTRADGLIWDDCNLHAFAQSADGSIWMGTSGGLARYHPDGRRQAHAGPPAAVFSEILLGGERIGASVNAPHVDYGRNAFEVSYSALTYAREHSVVFRYRLEPFSREWRETTARELRFPGLPAGNYRFELLARNGWGDWSASPAVFAFEVRPPWWATALARWMYVLLAVTTVAGLLQWRTRVYERRLEAQRREQEKERIVAEAKSQLDALTHLNRVAEISEMAAGLAHEIWQPLSAIAINASAAVRLLDRPQPDIDEARQAMADIGEDQQRATRIIEQLRSGLRRGPRQPKPLNINKVVEAATGFARHTVETHRALVVLKLAPDLPLVLADETQMQQVIMNLLKNAVEAMSGFTLGDRKVEIRTSSTDHGRQVIIEVEDTGGGVPENVRHRVFDAQFTTKSEGLGLGLAIVKSIITAHGGRIDLEDGARGALFRIQLPSAET